MRHALLVLLLAGCSTSSTGSRELERPTAPPTHCNGYCAAVLRCAPEFYYVECRADCSELLSDRERAAVSGLTPAVVRCWAEAPSCERALACDGAK